ncbi:MAG: DnaJ domain [Actinomycetota bacterium]
MRIGPSPDELALARAELGVGSDADEADLRRAFRALARAHHPDHGGDALRFDRARRAFALLTEASQPAPPRVGAGRPSRRAREASAPPVSLEPAAIDPAGRAAVLAGRRALEPTVLAGLLLTDEGTIAPFRATSRAPGARTNRMAHALAEGSTSRLAIALRPVEGGTVLRTELVAVPRRARRALDDLRLEGAERGRGWVRTRGSAMTRLHQDHAVEEGLRAAVVAAVEGLADLLSRLAWPLSDWRPTG